MNQLTTILISAIPPATKPGALPPAEQLRLSFVLLWIMLGALALLIVLTLVRRVFRQSGGGRKKPTQESGPSAWEIAGQRGKPLPPERDAPASGGKGSA